MKTSELEGAHLDWAVAKCEKTEFTYEDWPWHELIHLAYSTDWSRGGPIIERERIGIRDYGGNVWAADDYIHAVVFGPTPLIAAMRCYVASKLGDEVDVPNDSKEKLR